MGDPGEVWFYHLERSSLDQVLPDLLERTLSRGWRAVVRSGDPEFLSALDRHLWTYRDDSFLPHGLEDEGQGARQPILLGLTGDNLNGAQALFLVQRAPVEDLAGYERVLVIFDGRDPAALEQARRDWLKLKAAGHPLTYWRQGEVRGWEKQA